MALHPPRNNRFPLSARADSPVDFDPYSHKQSYSAGYSGTSSQPTSPYPREAGDRDFFVPQQRQNTLGLGASTEKTGYSRWQWTFLIVVVVQAVLGLAIEGFVFATFQTHLAGWARQEASSKPYAATLPTYLALFIFGFVYEVGLVWDALRNKNTIQIIGLCLYNVGLLIEAAVQFLQLSDVVTYLGEQGPPQPGEGPALQHGFMGNVRPYIIAMPAVIGLGTVMMIVSTFYLYKQFSWSVFERYGGDKGIKKALRFYEVCCDSAAVFPATVRRGKHNMLTILQVYLSLLKFDFFFFLAFTVLFLVVVTETSDLEFYLTIVAIPVTIIIFIFALLWVKRESRPGMVVTIVCYPHLFTASLSVKHNQY
jgi:hypothetical protein